ncbi:MAG: asparagine synthase (glutamine-hydrolyzing) [Oscillospiraceae bacterium]|nr:asparagine synthase (glutamine-hydrolyzing) [Oscillospiraceae bacterium]
MRVISGEANEAGFIYTAESNQSMIISRGEDEYIIVCDGELYNKNELTRELESLGYEFMGKTDIEVIGRSYIEWREKSVEKLNGVFTFAVWDKNNKRLFFARDRIGVKPFFYSEKSGGFIFSSKISGILSNNKIPAEIGFEAVAEIILIGPGRTPGYGVFKNIYELEPGSFGTFEDGKLKKYKYWDFTDRGHGDNFEQTLEKVRGLVTDSIDRQLICENNTKICAMLSGGLDSSLITSAAAKNFSERGQKLYAFSVDYRDNAKYFSASKFQPNSDGEYIERMKEYLKGEYFTHYQIVLDTRELADALYSAVDARDLPGMADVDASLLLFCKEIKNFADIALSGESADEIFGGYPWYRDENIRSVQTFPWSRSEDFRKDFFRKDFLGKHKNYIDNYISERYVKAISESDASKTDNKTDKRIKELVNLNIKWFMQTLLERQNRMSSYSDFAIRAPFCDYRIAEYLYNIPWEYKDFNNKEKGLLRLAMRDYLPDEVLWRKKSPYPKTHNPEYLKTVSKALEEIINEPSSPLLKIADKKALGDLINGGAQSSGVPWYGQLMTTPQTIAYFVQINYWLEKYDIKILI